MLFIWVGYIAYSIIISSLKLWYWSELWCLSEKHIYIPKRTCKKDQKLKTCYMSAFPLFSVSFNARCITCFPLSLSCNGTRECFLDSKQHMTPFKPIQRFNLSSLGVSLLLSQWRGFSVMSDGRIRALLALNNLNKTQWSWFE